MGKKKDLDKLYAISDDDSSDNDANIKVYNRDESAYHENKIREYTNQMNEVKLAEKKAKWLNLDDFKSDDDDDDRDEKKNATGSVAEPKIEQQNHKTPSPSKIEMKREKKSIECSKEPTHEVNNNNNNSKYSNCESMTSSGDDVIEVDDCVKTATREFNRRTIDRDDKIEARLDKVK